MIPLTASVVIENRERQRRLYLPIPLFLVWLLLLPFAVVLFPLLAVVAWGFRMNPIRVTKAGWNLLVASKGTDVQVGQQQQLITVRIG